MIWYIYYVYENKTLIKKTKKKTDEGRKKQKHWKNKFKRNKCHAKTCILKYV